MSKKQKNESKKEAAAHADTVGTEDVVQEKTEIVAEPEQAPNASVDESLTDEAKAVETVKNQEDMRKETVPVNGGIVIHGVSYRDIESAALHLGMRTETIAMRLASPDWVSYKRV